MSAAIELALSLEQWIAVLLPACADVEESFKFVEPADVFQTIRNTCNGVSGTPQAIHYET
jgi:hypothetical protein